MKKYGKKYGYELWRTVYAGGKEREYAVCPYCGQEGHSEITSQNILLYKLNDEGNLTIR